MITTVCKISYGSQTVPPIVPAVQGDTGRAISFEIADFTPPAGATATYFILKPSGEAIYNSATITDNSILCELTAQSLAEAGENRMQVRVLQGEDIVTSFEVILMVRTFLGDDAIESGTEMNIFDQAVEQATEQFQENAEQIVEEVIESIPEDYTELTEEVEQLNERLDIVEDDLFTEITTNYTSAYTSGSITLNGGIGTTVNPTQATSANYLSQIVPCKKGDTFTISGLGGDGPRIYGFTDTEYKLLKVGGPNITVTDRVLEADEDGYFISNVNKNNAYSLVGVSNSSKLDALITDYNGTVTKLENTQEEVTESKIKLASNIVKYGNPIDTSDATTYENSKCNGLTGSYKPSIGGGDAYLIDMAIPENVKRIYLKKFTLTGQMVLLYTEDSKGVNYTKTSSPDVHLIYNGDDYIVIDCEQAITTGYERMLLSFDSKETSGIYVFTGFFTVKNNLEYVTPLAGLNMFDSIACLGDSYTQGFIVKSDNTATIAKKPFPAVLHDDLGVTVDNYGVGGTTTKTYITHVDGLPKVLNASAHDLYMICFGINDSLQSITIGSASDIHDEDYTLNADTFYGNYGKMIQMLQEEFPLARYVIIGNWGIGLWYAGYNPYAKASKGIAEHFGIPYVNPLDDPFFYSDIFTNDVGGHPSQVAYTGMAYAVERLMGKCIAENYLYYRYAGIEEVSD